MMMVMVMAMVMAMVMVTVNTSPMLMTASGLFPLERALAAGVKVIALMSHVTGYDDSVAGWACH